MDCSTLAAFRTALFACLTRAAAVFLADCSDPGAPELLIRDERGQLDTLRVDAAAAPLLARGADVAVIIVERGDDRGEDLSRLGWQSTSATARATPSCGPAHSWSALLPAATLRAIREGQLNPALRSGDPDGSGSTSNGMSC